MLYVDIMKEQLQKLKVPELKKILLKFKSEVGAVSKLKKEDLIKKILDLEKKGFPIPKNTIRMAAEQNELQKPILYKKPQYRNILSDYPDILTKKEAIQDINDAILRNIDDIRSYERDFKRRKMPRFEKTSRKNKIKSIEKGIKLYRKDLVKLRKMK